MSRPWMLSAAAVLFAALAAPALADPVVRPAPAPHPFDPLDAGELARVASLVRGDSRFPAEAWLASVDLAEPPKAAMLAPNPAPARRADVIVLDSGANRTYEVVVDLTAARVVAWDLVEGVQPGILLEEYGILADLVTADPRWQAAMRRRGFEDLSKVVVDGWAPGPSPGTRLMRGLTYVQGDQINYYGRPVEGILAVVDMNARTVLEVIDTGIVPAASSSQDLSAEALAPSRQPLPPLYVVQPAGVGYRREGWAISWDRWRFRFGLRNQATADHGLSRFVADNESLSGQDLVIWYTLGITHPPREEEWPIMNVHRASFTLLPSGFSVRNPALDLAP